MVKHSSFPLVPLGHHHEYSTVLQNSEAFAAICVEPFVPKPFNSLSSFACFLLTDFLIPCSEILTYHFFLLHSDLITFFSDVIMKLVWFLELLQNKIHSKRYNFSKVYEYYFGLMILGNIYSHWSFISAYSWMWVIAILNGPYSYFFRYIMNGWNLPFILKNSYISL